MSPAPTFSAPLAQLSGLDPSTVETALQWVSLPPILLGTFIIFTGAIGVARFPDFYARAHPAGMIDTLGQTLVLLGLGLASDDPWIALKLAMICVVLFITAPTSTHALVRAAWREGLKPWLKPGDMEGRLERDTEESPASASSVWLRDQPPGGAP